MNVLFFFKGHKKQLSRIDVCVTRRSIVGETGKQSIRREWERVQVKSHQLNSTILKV
jgi:hypothetical protein